MTSAATPSRTRRTVPQAARPAQITNGRTGTSSATAGSARLVRATELGLSPGSLGPVADPIPRPGPEARGAVRGIRELAAPERQAAAADALGEPGLQALELGDALVDACGPGAGQARPVLPGRRAARRQLRERGADLVEREPDALRKDDERDAPQ